VRPVAWLWRIVEPGSAPNGTGMTVGRWLDASDNALKVSANGDFDGSVGCEFTRTSETKYVILATEASPAMVCVCARLWRIQFTHREK